MPLWLNWDKILFAKSAAIWFLKKKAIQSLNLLFWNLKLYMSQVIRDPAVTLKPSQLRPLPGQG